MAPKEQSEEDPISEIRRQVRAIFEMLQGKDGGLGLSQKVAIMWRIHAWLLCTASACMGGVFTLLTKHYFFP